MATSTHNLFEDFGFRGIWWLPHDPEDKVSGDLSYAAQGEIVLDLNGSFRGIDSFGAGQLFQPGMIHGITSTGLICTLCQNLESSQAFGAPGYLRSTFMSDLLLIGKHFETPDDVVFNSVKVNFTHLEGWLRQRPIEVAFPHNEGHRAAPAATYRFPREFDVRIPSISSSVSSVSQFSTSGDSITSFTMRHMAFLKVTADERQPYTWYRTVLRDLRSFMTLMVGEPVWPIHLQGIGDSVELRPGVLVPQVVDIFFTERRPTRPKDLPFFDVLLPFPLLQDNIASIIELWFQNAERLRSAELVNDFETLTVGI